MSRRPNVNGLFDQFNDEFFQGKIPKIPVVMNDRLQTSAGRCKGVYISKLDDKNPNPFMRNRRVRWLKPTELEIHSRLFDDIGWDYTRDGWNRPESELTLLHEMTHAYLWWNWNDKGHGQVFQNVMSRITGKYGVSHTHHFLNVSKWRRMHGFQRPAKKQPFMAGAINPFQMG